MMNPEENRIMINNIKTTMEMENQNLTISDLNMLDDFANNRISMEDAMYKVKQTIF